MGQGRGQSFQQFGDHFAYRDASFAPVGVIFRLLPSARHERDGDPPLCFTTTVHSALISQGRPDNHAA